MCIRLDSPALQGARSSFPNAKGPDSWLAAHRGPARLAPNPNPKHPHIPPSGAGQGWGTRAKAPTDTLCPTGAKTHTKWALCHTCSANAPTETLCASVLVRASLARRCRADSSAPSLMRTWGVGGGGGEGISGFVLAVKGRLQRPQLDAHLGGVWVWGVLGVV